MDTNEIRHIKRDYDSDIFIPINPNIENKIS